MLAAFQSIFEIRGGWLWRVGEKSGSEFARATRNTRSPRWWSPVWRARYGQKVCRRGGSFGFFRARLISIPDDRFIKIACWTNAGGKIVISRIRNSFDLKALRKFLNDRLLGRAAVHNGARQN